MEKWKRNSSTVLLELRFESGQTEDKLKKIIEEKLIKGL